MSKDMNHESFVETIADLGICGCGNPEYAYKAVHEIMLLIREIKEAPSKDLYSKYSDLTDNPYALTVLYMLDDREFLEHGTSIYGCWLTAKGLQLLEALDILKVYGYDFGEAENSIWSKTS